MRIRLVILPALNSLAWGFAFLGGIDGVLGVKERTGHITPAQLAGFVAVPLILFAAPILPAIFLRGEKQSDIPTLISWLTLLFLLPWLFLSGSGM